MNTLLSYLTVLAVAALLLAPSLYGALRERRLDRQIRAAAGQPVEPARPAVVIRAPDPRIAVTVQPGRRAASLLFARIGMHTDPASTAGAGTHRT